MKPKTDLQSAKEQIFCECGHSARMHRPDCVFCDERWVFCNCKAFALASQGKKGAMGVTTLEFAASTGRTQKRQQRPSQGPSR